MPRAVVIGAGVGGLTAAAVLARSGVEVIVLEAHVDPGGCAATFFHQGYRFDSGATLAAGFYPGGPMERVALAAGIPEWDTRPAQTAMVVHLPDGLSVPRRVGEARWEELSRAFGQPAVDFFRWQERTADALWQLAMRLPPWPPRSPGDLLQLAISGSPWLARHHSPALLGDALQPVAAHLRHAEEALRLFVDGQLLISAQVESPRANALYGAAALDLPRRGVVNLAGGMGAISETLVAAVRQNGGKVLLRHEVTRIRADGKSAFTVETKRDGNFPADLVIANLTPWNAADLLEEGISTPLNRLPPRPQDGWGAFMVYVGMDGSALPLDYPLHHQVLARRPLGEGNSVFASLSPAWDASRAPAGHRALTLSTHTTLDDWWHLYENDRPAYEDRKASLAEKTLETAERAIPGLRSAARLMMPGTPVTFQRFTRRKWGWVGGFPQTSPFRAFSPRLARNLWLVGDSIFPGQSTAAVALGGLRVAGMALKALNLAPPDPSMVKS